MRSGVKMIKDGAELIKNGHSMVICPEGTRNQEKEMLPFKEGSLKMADKADCPVVPVAIIDSDQMLEVRPGFHIKSGSPTVIYGTPFYIRELDKENRKHAGAYVQGIIKDMIDSHGGQTGK
jgi:1-acyl-sn-glycerol-3-phosphate acyltransferase